MWTGGRPFAGLVGLSSTRRQSRPVRPADQDPMQQASRRGRQAYGVPWMPIMALMALPMPVATQVTLSEESSYRLPTGKEIDDLALLKDGTIAFTCVNGSRIQFIDTAGRMLEPLELPSPAFSFAEASEGVLEVVNLFRLRIDIVTVGGRRLGIRSLSMNPTGQLLDAALTVDGWVGIWTPPERAAEARVIALEDRSKFIAARISRMGSGVPYDLSVRSEAIFLSEVRPRLSMRYLTADASSSHRIPINVVDRERWRPLSPIISGDIALVTLTDLASDERRLVRISLDPPTVRRITRVDAPFAIVEGDARWIVGVRRVGDQEIVRYRVERTGDTIDMVRPQPRHRRFP